jgi:hypothetical protein
MSHRNYGTGHIVSVETFGGRRRTILATHQGYVTMGAPLPEGGWVYAIIDPVLGRHSTAEAEYRDEAVVLCCDDLGLDPVRFIGRGGARRARARMESA